MLRVRAMVLVVALWASAFGFFALPSPAAAAELPDPVVQALAAPARAESILEGALAGQLSAADAPWVLLYLGEVERLSGDTAHARVRFQQIATEYPTHPARQLAILGMAVIDATENPSGNNLATLELITDEGVPPSLNTARYLILAQQAIAAQDADKIKLYSKKARKYAGETDKSAQKEVEIALSQSLMAARPVEGEAPVETPALPADLELLSRIRSDLSKGDFASVIRNCDSFDQKFVDSPFKREVAYARARAQKAVKPVRNRVAVLLPLTGTYAQPGLSLRHALELAAVGADIQIEFLDTAGKPEQCVKQLEGAVIERGASVAIGPLLKEEALVCAPTAQALHIPMLTLTTWEEAVMVGDQIFRPGPSTSQLIGGLLDYSFQVQGLKTYAVLYPKNAYGENAAKIFTDAVVARGGTVSMSTSYDPAASDFRSAARQLGRKTSGRTPVIDFDAVFIPDSYQRVALVVSAMAFEDFPVGSYRPQGTSARLQLLGLNGWNNPDIIRRGGRYLTGSVFIDAFDPGSNEVSVGRFTSSFQDRAGSPPTVVEGVAYDGLKLVVAAIASSEPDLALALHAARIPDAVAGSQGFGEDRQMMRTWRLLTITSESIGPVGAGDTTTP